jgi:hypothetical protein
MAQFLPCIGGGREIVWLLGITAFHQPCNSSYRGGPGGYGVIRSPGERFILKRLPILTLIENFKKAVFAKN